MRSFQQLTWCIMGVLQAMRWGPLPGLGQEALWTIFTAAGWWVGRPRLRSAAGAPSAGAVHDHCPASLTTGMLINAIVPVPFGYAWLITRPLLVCARSLSAFESSGHRLACPQSATRACMAPDMLSRAQELVAGLQSPDSATRLQVGLFLLASNDQLVLTCSRAAPSAR